MSEAQVIPLRARADMEDTREQQSTIRTRVIEALACPGKDLALKLFELTLDHAGAVSLRQTMESTVRDTERELDGAPRNLYDDVFRRLVEARADLRNAAFVERLYLGGLDAVRARIDLIAASWRRQADVKGMSR